MRPDQIGINDHHICSLGFSIFENDAGRFARIVVVDRSDWGRVMEVCSVGFCNLDQGVWDRVESAFWVPLSVSDCFLVRSLEGDVQYPHRSLSIVGV